MFGISRINWKLFSKSLIACLMAAWITAFLYFQVEMWLFYLSLPFRPLEYLPSLDWRFFGMCGLIFSGIMIARLPAQFLMQKRNLNGPVWSVLVSAIVLSLVLLAANGFASPDALVRLYLAICIAAAIFWLIRRPDLDHKSPSTKPVTPTTTP